MSGGSLGSRGDSSGLGSSKHGSSSRRSSYEERCVDPVEPPAPPPKTPRRGRPRDADGREGEETASFIAAEASETQTCDPCGPPRGCRVLVCSVLTCGLYRLCLRAPRLAPKEEAEKVSLRAADPGDEKLDDDGGGDWTEDVCIGGVRVDGPRECLETAAAAAAAYVSPRGPYASLADPLGPDDWEDGEEDVDSLIAKKLLELYSEYQIEELARCTSDSLFLRKSKAIHQLINSLAEEHQMDEQEAECRLVRGIIRISTRKSTKRRPPPPANNANNANAHAASRVERTLSDSGNETMRDSDSFSFSNNNDYKSNPNIQISELTSYDKFAREMWRNNRGQTSSSSSAYSPSHTDTDASGAPLIRTSVRT